MNRARLDKRTKELLSELDEVYRFADELFEGWSCLASTDCCRFGITGLEPFVTSIEFLAVQVAIGEGGSSLANRIKAAREAARARTNGHGERVCPLLDEVSRCSIYRARPLGCRTYFCNKAEANGRVPHQSILELVRRVEQIALRHTTDGDRPHRFGKLFGI